MPQYMVIDNIKGDVSTQSYVGAIDIKSVEKQVDRAVVQRIGTSTREVGIPSINHVQISKNEDSASALLWQYFYSGKVIPKVVIDRCALNSGKAEWQSRIILNNVMVSSITNQSHEMGGQELLTLSYSKIEHAFRGQSAAGQWQTAKHTSYDLETAKSG